MAHSDYSHTQRAPLHLIVFGVAGIMGIAGWMAWPNSTVTAILLGTSLVVVLFACSFQRLTVIDEGDHLALRFGPLPLFSREIRYSDITAAEVGKTSWVDGWGIHYVFGRGWTYNLWGFDCVVLNLGRRVLRIGTDDAENLNAFLHERCGELRDSVASS